MEISKQLIIGLPETGKTTFLAALWQVVESEEVPGSLIVSEVHGVRDHLNQIREQWLNCQQVERTKITAEKLVSFRLLDRKTNKTVEVSLPDISGETFRHQWEFRQWTPEFDALASQSSGVILFVHPRAIFEPQRIDFAVDELAAALDENPNPNSSQSPIDPWSPNHAPTQVKLVEILQFLRARAFHNRPLPIAVVVSAWDLVKGKQVAPSKWVHDRLPFLHQFLTANNDDIFFSTFGISAQGGELADANQLQNHIKASERIIVTTPDGLQTHDITAPLRWLLER